MENKNKKGKYIRLVLIYSIKIYLKLSYTRWAASYKSKKEINGV